MIGSANEKAEEKILRLVSRRESLLLVAMLSRWMDVLVDLSSRYSSIHGRLVNPVTIVGMLTSVVTIVVLQRKNFLTPTNLILQHIALFDTMVLLFYNLYSLYFYILHEPNPFVGQSIFWPCFAIINAHVGLTAHSIALWLTCLLAIVSRRRMKKEREKECRV